MLPFHERVATRACQKKKQARNDQIMTIILYSKKGSAHQMPTHRPHLDPRIHVPNLHISILIPDPKITPISRPRECAHRRSLFLVLALIRVAQGLHIPRISVPDVSRGTEADRDLVRTRPRKQVEIVVVDESGRV